MNTTPTVEDDQDQPMQLLDVVGYALEFLNNGLPIYPGSTVHEELKMSLEDALKFPL